MISYRKDAIFAHIVAIKRAKCEQNLINIIINLTLSLISVTRIDFLDHLSRHAQL